MVDRARQRLAKRREILRKAALDYHAGRLTLADYLRTIASIRPH